MGEFEEPLLKTGEDLVYGAYEDTSDDIKTWWKADVPQTYKPNEHHHDGEIVTRSTYTVGPKRSNVIINDGPSSTGIRAVHGGPIGTKQGVHIHVHGFNTDQSKASKEFSTVAKRFTDTKIEHIGYNWDSFQPEVRPPSREMVLDEEWQEWVYGKTVEKVPWKKGAIKSDDGLLVWEISKHLDKWVDTWYATVPIARDNGRRLGLFIMDLLTGSPRGEEPNIFLSGYSLGSQVVLSAVRHLATYYDDPVFKSNGGILSGVYLVGAAVPDKAVSTRESDTWEEKNPFADIYDRPANPTRHPYGKELQTVVKNKPQGNIHVAWGSSDWTAGTIYNRAMGTYGLGSTGPYEPGKQVSSGHPGGSASIRVDQRQPTPSTLTDRNYSRDWESWFSLKTYYKDFHGLWLDHRTVWKDIEKRMKESNKLYGPDPAALAANATITKHSHGSVYGSGLTLSGSSSPRITFSAEDSTAEEGDITDHTWSFGGDHGRTEVTGELVHVPLDSIDDTGTYEVTLVVTDDAGNTDSVTRSYRVKSDFLYADELKAIVDVHPYPDPDISDALSPSPEADPELDPDLIESESETGLELDQDNIADIIGGIEFDPRRSSDGGGSIESADWEFHGFDPDDIDSDNGTIRIPLSEFPGSGEYDVTLTLEGENGQTDSTTETYTIESAWKPDVKPLEVSIDAPNTAVQNSVFSVEAQVPDGRDIAEYNWISTGTAYTVRDSDGPYATYSSGIGIPPGVGIEVTAENGATATAEVEVDTPIDWDRHPPEITSPDEVDANSEFTVTADDLHNLNVDNIDWSSDGLQDVSSTDVTDDEATYQFDSSGEKEISYELRTKSGTTIERETTVDIAPVASSK